MKDSTILSIYILGLFFLLVNFDMVVSSESKSLDFFIFMFFVASVGSAIAFLVYNSINYIIQKKKELEGVKK